MEVNGRMNYLENLKEKKAQAAIMGVIIAFMLVATFAIILEPLFDFIEIGVNATVNATNGALIATTINLIPVFMALIILVAIVALITGRVAG